MNRRKVEAFKQFESLKEECKFTVSLLQKLIDSCSNCVEDINQLESKDFRLYSKYFLSIMQFQAASMQRVMEWNIEFEDFLLQKLPTNLETFKTLVHRRGLSISEISQVSSQTCSLETVSPTETVRNFLELFNKDTAMNDLTLKCDNEVQITDSNNRVEKNEVLPIVRKEIVLDNKPILKNTNSNEITSVSQSEDFKKEQPSKTETSGHYSISSNHVFETGEASLSSSNNLVSLEDGTEKIAQKHSKACFSEEKMKAPQVREVTKQPSKHERRSTSSGSSSDDCAFETLESSFSSSDNFLSMDDDKTITTSLEFNKNEQRDFVKLDNSRNISERLHAYPMTASIDKPIYVEKNSKAFCSEEKKVQYGEFKKEQQTSKIEANSTNFNECVFETLEDFSGSNNFLSLNHDHTEKALQKPKIIELENNSRSISQRLNAYPVTSLYSIEKANIPRAPMPDVSLKPSEDTKESISDNACYTLTSDNLRHFSGKEEAQAKNAKVFSEFKSSLEKVSESPNIPVTVGDPCMIGYVESPSEIYIQVANENSISLDTLSADIGEFCSSTPFECTSKSAARRLLDNICAYYDLTDGSWYRVEVADWMMPKSDQVTVYFVDYGYKYIASYKQLCPLSKRLQQEPRNAQLCHLAHLYPPGSSKHKKVTVWPEEVINSFYEILGDVNKVVFRIVHSCYDEKRQSYEIDIIKVEEESSECTIGQILIESGMAEEIIDSQAEGLGEMEPDTINNVLEAYFQNHITEEPHSISDAIMHYNPQDEAKTCKNLRKDGTCYKGTSCRFRHVPLTNGYTRDKHARYCRAFNDDNLPRVGEEVIVVISHVIDLDTFYVQICDQNSRYYPRHTTLTGLIETMNSPDVVKTYRPLKFIPSEGEIVTVKHWNSFWYRGQIKAVTIPEEGEVVTEVYVVDFGDILEVALSELREINPAFLHLSFQAVECMFYNVKHREGFDSMLEKLHFETNYLSQKFSAKIMGITGRLELLLFNREQNEELGLKILEEGFGEFKTQHLLPADERILVD